MPRLSVLGDPQVNLAFSKVNSVPGDIRGFSLSESSVGEELHQVGAVVAKSPAAPGDGIDELEELLVAGQGQLAFGGLGTSNARGRIFVADPAADTEVDYHLQGGQRVVVNAGAVLGVEVLRPFLAIGFRDLGKAGGFEDWPAFEQGGNGFAAVKFRAGFQLHVAFEILLEQGQRIAEGGISIQKAFRAFELGLLLVFNIAELDLGDGEGVGFEGAPNVLAACPDTRIVGAPMARSAVGSERGLSPLSLRRFAVMRGVWKMGGEISDSEPSVSLECLRFHVLVP